MPKAESTDAARQARLASVDFPAAALRQTRERYFKSRSPLRMEVEQSRNKQFPSILGLAMRNSSSEESRR